MVQYLRGQAVVELLLMLTTRSWFDTSEELRSLKLNKIQKPKNIFPLAANATFKAYSSEHKSGDIGYRCVLLWSECPLAASEANGSHIPRIAGPDIVKDIDKKCIQRTIMFTRGFYGYLKQFLNRPASLTF